MKTLITLIFIIVLSGIVNAQWEADVRMTNNTAISRTSSNNAWCIASNGNVVHIVYFDARTGSTDIYYKRSIDGGVNWENDINLTNSSSNSSAVAPSIALNGTSVHLVWRDSRDGPNGEIYYKRSIDNGVTWDADIRLTNNSELSWQPTICVSGLNLHVVWYDNRDGVSQVYYKRSIDGGLNWEADVRLTSHSYNETNPSVCVSGTNVHVVWYDNQNGITKIYYKRSMDGGLTWSSDYLLSNAGDFPTIAVSGSKVYAAWNGANSIQYRKSLDGGISWNTESILTNAPNLGVPNPNICFNGSFVHIVWKDNRNGNYEIYYKKSRNEGLTWEADTRLTNALDESRNAFVAASNSKVHVVWQDSRDGNQEIYYKRDSTGNSTGIHNLNKGIPDKYKLYQNYPNPFNPTTKIRFSIPMRSPIETFGDDRVVLNVYDILGKEVAILVNERLNPGTYEVEWNARLGGSTTFPSGVYFYRLTTEGFSETKKMVLIK
ncbi:MAG TPA: T9SS type A sorting domain-containing protein [Ignavibacteria bacterium]